MAGGSEGSVRSIHRQVSTWKRKDMYVERERERKLCWRAGYGSLSSSLKPKWFIFLFKEKVGTSAAKYLLLRLYVWGCIYISMRLDMGADMSIEDVRMCCVYRPRGTDRVCSARLHGVVID